MLNLKKVAVTGGLSCGKSSVCRILEEFGASVVSADKIVHQLLSSDTNLGHEVVNLLGPDILVNDKIERSRVSRIVFHDLDLLRSLEALVHPVVFREIEREYERQSSLYEPPPLFIAEIPLLFETERQGDFDLTIAVLSDLELCFTRFSEQNGGDRKQFNTRVARQLPMFNKAQLADYVIMNNTTLTNLRQKVQELYGMLVAK